VKKLEGSKSLLVRVDDADDDDEKEENRGVFAVVAEARVRFNSVVNAAASVDCAAPAVTDKDDKDGTSVALLCIRWLSAVAAATAKEDGSGCSGGRSGLRAHRFGFGPSNKALSGISASHLVKKVGLVWCVQLVS